MSQGSQLRQVWIKADILQESQERRHGRREDAEVYLWIGDMHKARELRSARATTKSVYAT